MTSSTRWKPATSTPRCREYAGPLLPQSVSPAIARLRTELSASLRGAVLATGNLALLRRWLDLPEGRDDRDGWRVLHDAAQSGR